MSKYWRKKCYKSKENLEKANNTKYSKTKLAWFSRLIRSLARKWSGLILQLMHEPTRAHTSVTMSEVWKWDVFLKTLDIIIAFMAHMHETNLFRSFIKYQNITFNHQKPHICLWDCRSTPRKMHNSFAKGWTHYFQRPRDAEWGRISKTSTVKFRYRLGTLGVS